MTLRISYTLGECCVDIHDWGTDTVFKDGTSAMGMPEDTNHYRWITRDLGYKDDVLKQCIEHELAHTLCAVIMGAPYSPILWHAAHKDQLGWYPHWREEEAVVQAFQKQHRGRMEEFAAALMKDY